MCTCVGLEMKNFVCEGIRALVSKSTLTGLALGSRATNSRSAIYTQGSTFRLRSVSPYYGCVLSALHGGNLSQVILANPWA